MTMTHQGMAPSSWLEVNLGGVATTVVWKGDVVVLWGAESLPTTYGTKY